MSRVRSSFLTMASSTMFVVISSLVGIVSTPLLLSWLGSARFGAFRALSDSLGYLTLLDLGLGASVMASLAKGVNQNDAAGTRKTMFNALLSYGRIVALAIACGLVLIYLLPSIVRQPGIDASEIRLAGAIFLCSAILLPFGVFRSLAETQLKGGLVNALLILQSLLTTAGLLIAARQGWGLAGQSAAMITAQIPTVVFLTIRGASSVPGVYRETRDPETTKRLWSLNWHALVQNVCGRAALLSDNIIVSWGMGAAAVAPFFITQRMGSLVQQQLQSLGNATWAPLMQLHYGNKRERFAERLAELTSVVSGIGAVALGTVFAYNRALVAFWTGTEFFAGELVTLVACLNSWLWAISSLWGWPITTSGEMGRWAPWAVLFATINVAVSLTLVKTLGWLGPLLGTTAGFVLVNWWAQPRLLQRIFGVPARRLWQAALKPLAWALPYTCAIYYISHAHAVQSVAVLLEMAAAGAGGALLWWLLGLKPESRDQWQNRIRVAFARA